MMNTFNELFHDSPLFVAVIDDSLVCRDLNAVWRDYLSMTTAAVEAIPVAQLFSLENELLLMDQITQVIHQGNVISGRSVTLREKDPAVRFMHKGLLSAWRISQTQEERMRALLVFTETTEYSRAINQFNRLQTTHELILNAVGEGIYGVDCEGNTTFVNEAATQILGWRAEDVIGKSLHDIHHHSYPDGRPYPSSECPIYAAVTDGKVHRGDDEFFWRTDGISVPVEYTSTPLREDGKLKGAVVVFRDITERRKNERQREAAYTQIKILKDLLERERDYLRDEINVNINFGEIIGESQALKRTLAQIEAVAKTSTSVLILGESGVGKEMVARAIHANSSRADKPLVKVNCASIPKDLFESEFFGHVRGSFTGAHRDRVGRLHLAAGGTLFLDEVGEIPLDLQGKLLRALQEHEFERVGDDKTIKVDVRIVAATNRDLKAEVEAGRFRKDLYYRLSIFPIEVPPLRERIQDIGPLAIQFLNNICKELGRDPLTLTRQQLDSLNRYHWPGNIRELKNVIERAVILTKGSRLRLDLAMSHNHQNEKPLIAAPPENNEFVTDAIFREQEKLNMVAVLRHTNWRISGTDGAAELLGIKPSTFAYRMKVYGIKQSDYP
ncbi:sigma 54-interacting transcriptional regulator [Nitrosomonas communis]|uniref:sigma 54-interacting transcriptional regulator n=1 Tax=Nitrosomonas communis TaxID=44574 RepID=UPI0026E987F8|nr:sigma 54-interacting transcriptional regulator [Nitrosomonas communis]MCO6427383.1 sigma 54-interacting transcriptional regulator [Nitrosomonas communis]